MTLSRGFTGDGAWATIALLRGMHSRRRGSTERADCTCTAADNQALTGMQGQQSIPTHSGPSRKEYSPTRCSKCRTERGCMRTVKYKILPMMNTSPAAAAVTGNCAGCRTAVSAHRTQFASNKSASFRNGDVHQHRQHRQVRHAATAQLARGLAEIAFEAGMVTPQRSRVNAVAQHICSEAWGCNGVRIVDTLVERSV